MPRENDSGVRIYIGKVSHYCQKEELEELFIKEVKKQLKSDLKVQSCWVARSPPGFAFMELESRQDADKCVEALNGVKECSSDALTVEIARPNEGNRREGGDRGRGRGRGGGRGRFPQNSPPRGGGYRGQSPPRGGGYREPSPLPRGAGGGYYSSPPPQRRRISRSPLRGPPPSRYADSYDRPPMRADRFRDRNSPPPPQRYNDEQNHYREQRDNAPPAYRDDRRGGPQQDRYERPVQQDWYGKGGGSGEGYGGGGYQKARSPLGRPRSPLSRRRELSPPRGPPRTDLRRSPPRGPPQGPPPRGPPRGPSPRREPIRARSRSPYNGGRRGGRGARGARGGRGGRF